MKRSLSANESKEILSVLKTRIEQYPERHRGISWERVQEQLESAPGALWTLSEMDRTGGEPDLVLLGGTSERLQFVDCSTESPIGRRSLCYDRAGWESRKTARPETTGMDMASSMGANLLTEQEYFALQGLGEFDCKTSSWIRSPPEIRNLGGALYAEKRYGRVFVGHNGAQSYFATRGFRVGLSL